MTNEKVTEKLVTGNPINPYGEISAYDFSVRLQAKIKKYKGGGITGVWEALDPRFKPKKDRKENKPSKMLKSPRDDTTVTKDTFRRQVGRLVNENLKYEKINLGVGNNILLLMNVLEILEIKNLSDLIGTSFQKPTTEQYAIDTNIRIRRTIKKLDNIWDEIQMERKKKPRFTVNKISNDWLAVLNEIKDWIDPPKDDMDDPMTLVRRINRYTWIDSFTRNLTTPHSQFGAKLHTTLNKYREYFFNDILLHKYCEEIGLLNTSDYELNRKHILSPLYALYFLTLMYKRYLYCLSSSICEKRKIKSDSRKSLVNKPMETNKFDFISDVNIDEQSREIFGGRKLGEYIYIRTIALYNLLKRLLNKAVKSDRKISEDKFQEYHNIFKDVLSIIYSMNLDFTNINQEWLDNNVSKITSLNELYERMMLGISNLSQPTIDHINGLNENIQTLEKIVDMLEGEHG